jgi:hypothetical protein
MVLDEELRVRGGPGLLRAPGQQCEDRRRHRRAPQRHGQRAGQGDLHALRDLRRPTPTRPPSWSIRADKVVEDRDKQIIYYRNAVIELFGVPVFYAPVFWHPDPSAERKSGLLPPKIVASERRGLSYEQPYALDHLAVGGPGDQPAAEHQRVNPFLNLQWRRRFSNGADQRPLRLHLRERPRRRRRPDRRPDLAQLRPGGRRLRPVRSTGAGASPPSGRRKTCCSTSTTSATSTRSGAWSRPATGA